MSKPITRRALGQISVAIFENEREGDLPPAKSVSLSRSYFDRQEEDWKSTAVSLNPSDIPVVRRLLEEIESELIVTD